MGQYLDSLFFLVANVFMAILLPLLIRTFLFFPKKKITVFGKTLVFTPGYALKKKDFYLEKFEFYQKSYDDYCQKGGSPENFFKKLEKSTYKSIKSALTRKTKIQIIPKFLLRKFQTLLSEISFLFAKHFVREFIPFLMLKFNLSLYIEIAKLKLDSDVITSFADRYFFKYVFLFLAGFGAIIGLFNMLIYLLLVIF